MRLSIGKKLGGGFGLLVVLVVALAGVVFVQAKAVEEQTRQTFDRSVPAVEVGLTLQGEIHHALSMHRGYMILGLDALAQERLDTWKTIDKAIEQMNELSNEWQDKALQQVWADCRARINELRVAQDRIAAVSHTSADLPADVMFYTDAAPFGEKMVENLQAILDLEDSMSATPERKDLVRRVGAAEGHLLKSRYAIAAYLTSGDSEDLVAVESCVAACQASVDRLMTMTGLLDERQREHFDAYLAARVEFLKLAKQAIAIRSGPEFCVSQDICLNTVAPLSKQADELIGQIVQAQTALKAEAVAATSEASGTMVAIVGWTTGGAVAIGLAVAFFLSRQIISSLRHIMEFTARIAQRDLSAPTLEIRTGDEFETLGASVNEMQQSIRNIITEVTNAAGEVAAASTQICASNDEIAAGVQGQGQQVERISAAILEMSASVREVAEQAGSASSNAESATGVATQGGKVVEQTIAGMTLINEAVSGSAASVTELGRRSEQIGEIIEVINNIAEQTNLLALNAAIEAARAGEHGRGFAVVADEVRKLAERTQVATEEVSQSVRAIQQETAVAGERMDSSRTHVANGVDLVGNAGQSLQEIVTGTSDVTAMIQRIAAGAEQQAEAAEDIGRGIEEISQLARAADESTRQASQASNQLSVKAEQLAMIVRQFKV
jgi:methyl-accepting chemotaxis protein